MVRVLVVPACTGRRRVSVGRRDSSKPLSKDPCPDNAPSLPEPLPRGMARREGVFTRWPAVDDLPDPAKCHGVSAGKPTLVQPYLLQAGLVSRP